MKNFKKTVFSFVVVVMLLTCVLVLPASAKEISTEIYKFTSADNWNKQQGAEIAIESNEFVFKNAGGSYAYIKNHTDFPPAKKLTTDNTAYNGKNLVDGIKLTAKNAGDSVDVIVFFHSAMGVEWKQTITIARGGTDFVEYKIPLAYLVVAADNKGTPVLVKDEILSEVLEDGKLIADDFDFYGFGLNLISTDATAKVSLGAVSTYYDDGTTDPVIPGDGDDNDDKDDVDKPKDKKVTAIHSFDSVTNWMSRQGAAVEMRNNEFVMKNTAGTYGLIVNKDNFYPAIKMTNDDKAWNGNNGIDALRVSIKNPGAATNLILFWVAENGNIWKQTVNVKGESDKYVDYELPIGNFQCNDILMKDWKTSDLKDLDFSIWEMNFNVVSVDPDTELFFSKLSKVEYESKDNGDGKGDGGKDNNDNGNGEKPKPDTGDVFPVIALVVLGASAVILIVSKKKRA